MMMMLGQLKFMNMTDKKMWVQSNRNPQLMSRDCRIKVAECLREFASEMEADRFEEDGQFVFHKAPMEAK